ncbi:MAG: hypothetical protein ACW967_06790 [Candidatus Hodarchaeales archaeon]|jgi:hypothetical protein
MLNIHVYGFIRKKFDPKASLAGQTIVTVNYELNETFNKLINRLDLVKDELGDCFVNGTVISDYQMSIPDNARIALFGSGMRLLCGGQHLKGHGIVEETPPKKVNYY